LDAAFSAVVKSPETKQRMLALGFTPENMNHDELGAFIRDQSDLWRRVIRQNHLTLEN
jgi:tripartite-type tricarboxylate transporter receptor subunit TctC